MCDHRSHSACTPSKGSTTAVADDPAEHPLLNTLTISERTIHRTCFTAGEARERVLRARENLLKEGRSPLTASDCSALLREAFRPRWAKESRLPERPPPHS
jgi:hypothetical protein